MPLTGDDGWDLVRATNAAFGILVTPADAAAIHTLGDLEAAVRAQLRARASRPCPSMVAFHRLRRALGDAMGASRSAVVPAARLDALLPRDGRRAAWRRLEASFGSTIPALQRPAAVTWAASGSALLVATSTYGFTRGALVIGAATFALLMLATRPLATRVPANIASVRGFVDTFVGELVDPRTARLPEPPGGWIDETVHRLVYDLAERELGLRRHELRPDARFDRLGVD